MKHLLIAFILISSICNGQIHLQNGQYSLVHHDSITATTRFIIVGASIMNSTFFYPNDIEDLINVSYPNVKVEVNNHCVAGWTTFYGASNIDGILAQYTTDNIATKTYVLIHLGGNNVTDNRPYTTDSTISTMISHYNYMLDAIIAKGFTPILNEISFRDYDDTTLANEENGSLPYNENIIKSINQNRGLGFVYEDGTSYFQLYNLIYNNPSWLSSDNIHVNNLAGLRNHFVNTICKYIFTGVPPTKIEKE